MVFRRFFAFRTRHQPYMVRHSYRHEIRSALTFNLAGSLAEGSFTGVIAAKNFDAGVVLMSVITAAPMFGNILALLWSDLAMGRRKVPIVNALQAGLVVMIASVALLALLPDDDFWKPVAGWIFAVQIIIARVLASGIITIRSIIWRANYPRDVRGQLISRIAVVATTVLAATTFLGSYLLDRDSKAFAYLYPSAAVLGAIGIWQFSKIRVRREVLLRRREEQLYAPRPESLSQTEEANVQNYEPRHGKLTPVELLRRFVYLFRQAYQILREDKPFRDYQRYQMFTGFSFMMFGPSLLYMVSTQMTDPKRDYLLATAVVQIIPMATSLLVSQAWAPLFDRVHITTFRVWQTVVSVTAQALLFVGAMAGLRVGEQVGLAIVAASQILLGVSNAGGNLAWNLGHNDFAPPDKVATYMGVHVMLTGVRGCFAPFFGSWLYLTVGRYVFLLSTLVCFGGLVGFLIMSRSAPKKVHYRAPAHPVKAGKTEKHVAVSEAS
jgi:hypothetical protein